MMAILDRLKRSITGNQDIREGNGEEEERGYKGPNHTPDGLEHVEVGL
jgi:hypothetical protein